MRKAEKIRENKREKNRKRAAFVRTPYECVKGESILKA